MARIRTNDQVLVISGKSRGKRGRVVRVLEDGQKVIVEKVNVVKRHTKPTQKNPQGGVVEKELGIHISNVMVIDPKSGERTRVGFRRLEDGQKVRYAKKSNEILQAK